MFMGIAICIGGNLDMRMAMAMGKVMIIGVGMGICVGMVACVGMGIGISIVMIMGSGMGNANLLMPQPSAGKQEESGYASASVGKQKVEIFFKNGLRLCGRHAKTCHASAFNCLGA